MKTKVTNKKIRETFSKVYSLGYCKLQELFNAIDPFAYNCGVNGWNCDFYEIDNVCISTGYNAIGESINYNIIEKYQNKIYDIQRKTLNYLERKEEYNKLLHEFIEEIQK
jgi:hypothetical protein